MTLSNKEYFKAKKQRWRITPLAMGNFSSQDFDDQANYKLQGFKSFNSVMIFITGTYTSHASASLLDCPADFMIAFRKVMIKQWEKSISMQM